MHYNPLDPSNQPTTPGGQHQQQSSVVKDVVDKQLVELNKLLIAEWRKLPASNVSHSHLDLLHSAHLLHEVAEASNTLLPPSPQQQAQHLLQPHQGIPLNPNVKHVMKSWRTRPLTFVDSLGAWHDVFTWRFQSYRNIVRLIEGAVGGVAEAHQQSQTHPQQATFFLHSLAQSHLHLAGLLRRSNQLDLAVDELNKLHTLPSLHTMDAQTKIYEHVKCLVRMGTSPGTVSSPSPTGMGGCRPDAIYEALEMIEGTQLQFLKKEQIGRLMVSKGILLSKLDK